MYDGVIAEKYRTLFKALRSGDIVIDLEANIGFYTSMMAWSGATVHPFEPNPHAREVLKRNVRRMPNVTVHREAVGGSDRVCPLYFHAEDSGSVALSESSSLMSEKRNVSTDKLVQTRVVDIADIVTNFSGRIKLCKMDVDGAEVEILERILDAGLHHCFEHVLVEMHDDQLPALSGRFQQIRDTLGDRSSFDLAWH